MRGVAVVLNCTSVTRIVPEPWVSPGTVTASLETAFCDRALFDAAHLRVVDRREQLEDELVDAFGPDAPERIDATATDVVAGGHPGRTTAVGSSS